MAEDNTGRTGGHREDAAAARGHTSPTWISSTAGINANGAAIVPGPEATSRRLPRSVAWQRRSLLATAKMATGAARAPSRVGTGVYWEPLGRTGGGLWLPWGALRGGWGQRGLGGDKWRPKAPQPRLFPLFSPPFLLHHFFPLIPRCPFSPPFPSHPFPPIPPCPFFPPFPLAFFPDFPPPFFPSSLPCPFFPALFFPAFFSRPFPLPSGTRRHFHPKSFGIPAKIRLEFGPGDGIPAPSEFWDLFPNPKIFFLDNSRFFKFPKFWGFFFPYLEVAESGFCGFDSKGGGKSLKIPKSHQNSN